jgi:hypothetical protein
MDIADHAHARALSPRSAVRSHDGWFIAGYVAFVLIACLAIYLTDHGPGMTNPDVAAIAAMPLP